LLIGKQLALQHSL